MLRLLLLLLLFGQRGDHALAFFFDIFGEARIFLFDKPGGQAQLQQRHRDDGSQVIQIGAFFGEFHRLNGFTVQLLQGVFGFLVSQHH